MFKGDIIKLIDTVWDAVNESKVGPMTDETGIRTIPWATYQILMSGLVPKNFAGSFDVKDDEKRTTQIKLVN